MSRYRYSTGFFYYSELISTNKSCLSTTIYLICDAENQINNNSRINDRKSINNAGRIKKRSV